MLASSARALAASVVLEGLAAEAPATGQTKDAAALFLQAAALADKSRQQELTAVALAEREASARPRPSGVNQFDHLLTGEHGPKK